MNRAKTVSLAEIAGIFGVTHESIRKWRKAGMPTRVVSGRLAFVLAECIRWRREQDLVGGGSSSRPEPTADKQRLLRAQADIAEVELALARGDLVQRSESLREVEDFVGRMVAGVTGGLSQFERQIRTCDSLEGAREITQKMLRVIFPDRPYEQSPELPPETQDATA